MAAIELLSVDDDAENSEDFDVIAGTPVLLSLKTADDATPIPSGVQVYVEVKDDDAQYWFVGKLTTGKAYGVLSSPGTYRLRRVPLAGREVGAFRAA
jgi:hypothetical protein